MPGLSGASCAHARVGQSCAHARIEWGNSAPTPGLTGRVNDEKNTPAVALRGQTHWRWPGDGFSCKKSEVGFPTSVQSEVGIPTSVRRIPTLAGAWQAGGFYAGQVARLGKLVLGVHSPETQLRHLRHLRLVSETPPETLETLETLETCLRSPDTPPLRHLRHLRHLRLVSEVQTPP